MTLGRTCATCLATLAAALLCLGLSTSSAHAQGASVKKDIHVFLDASGTIMRNRQRREGLSQVVTQLLEAVDPESGSPVVTAEDQVYIYQFANDAFGYRDSGIPLKPEEVDEAMKGFAAGARLDDIDNKSTLFDELLGKVAKLPGIREPMEDRIAVVIIASDFVHDRNDDPCDSKDRVVLQLASPEYESQLAALRRLVGLNSERGKTVIFGHIFADWREGEKMAFGDETPESKQRNERVNGCWRDFMNEKLLLKELEAPHFNAFSVSFRELEASPRRFLDALKGQLARIARKLRFEGKPRLEDRQGAIKLVGEVINDSEAPSQIFSLHFFSAAGELRGQHELPDDDREVESGPSRVEIPLPTQLGEALIRERDLFVAIKDLRTRGESPEDLTRFELGTQPFGSLRILKADLVSVEGEYAVVATLKNEGPGSSRVAGAIVRAADGTSYSARLLRQGASEAAAGIIEPGPEREFRFAIPSGALQTLFAERTFEFGVNDGEEETEDPVVSVDSPARPALEVTPDQEIALAEDGTLTIGVRVINPGLRDNAVRGVVVLTDRTRDEGTLFDQNVPLPAGQEEVLSVTIRGQDAARLSEGPLFLEVLDARADWEREAQPSQIIAIGEVIRPPVVLAEAPYTLDANRDVTLRSQGDGGQEKGELRLPVMARGDGQGRVAAVRLEARDLRIDALLPESAFITQRGRLLPIPLSRTEIEQMMSVRDDIAVYFLSDPGGEVEFDPAQVIRIPRNDDVTLRSSGFPLGEDGRAKLNDSAAMALPLTVTNNAPSHPVQPMSILVSASRDLGAREVFAWEGLVPGGPGLGFSNNQAEVTLEFNKAARDRLMTGQSIFLWLRQEGQSLNELGKSYEVELPRKRPLEAQVKRIPLDIQDGFLTLDLVNRGVMPVTLNGLEIRGGKAGDRDFFLEPLDGRFQFLSGARSSVRFPLGSELKEALRIGLGDTVTALQAYMLDETIENSSQSADARGVQIGLLDDTLTIEAIKPQRLVGLEQDLFVSVDGQFVRQRRFDRLQIESISHGPQDIEVRLIRGNETVYAGSQEMAIDPDSGAFNFVTKTANLDGRADQYRLVLVSTATEQSSAAQPVVDGLLDRAGIESGTVISALTTLAVLVCGFAVMQNRRDFAHRIAASLIVQPPEWLVIPIVGLLTSTNLFAGTWPRIQDYIQIPNYDLLLHFILLLVSGSLLALSLLSFVVPVSNRLADWMVARHRRKDDRNLQTLQDYQGKMHWICAGSVIIIVAVVLLFANSILSPPATPDGEGVVPLRPQVLQSR